LDCKEILNLVAVLGFLIKADDEVLYSGKKPFGIVLGTYLVV